MIKVSIKETIKSSEIIKAYERTEVRINFFPVLILSSSPKLNFCIKKPQPIDTAAAGVEIATMYDCTFSKAEIIFETILGYMAKQLEGKEKIRIIEIININKK